jgi:hypothetical protein
MSYLYDELPRSAGAPIAAHLRSCQKCRDQVTQWQGARKRLTHWKLNVAPTEANTTRAWPVLKWGLAAAVVLGLGFSLGRLSAPVVDPAAIRVAVEQSLRTSLTAQVKQQIQDELRSDLRAAVRGRPESLNTDFRRDLRAGLDEWKELTLASANAESQKLLLDFNDGYRANRQQDHKAILTLFDRLEQKRQTEYLSLRRAVETVAVVADNKFQRTENELGQLASYAQTRFTLDPSDESNESLTPANQKGTE